MEYTQRLGVVVPQKGKRGLGGLKRRIRAGELARTVTRERVRLFRGFDARGAADFERPALAVVLDFQEQYPGAFPLESKTRYVFSASEPSFFYPIMQHYRETSFLPQAPRRNFFYGKNAPSVTAETPVTDFPSFAQSLNPKIRRVLETSRIRSIRNRFGPQSSLSFELWSLKRRNQMFKTADKSKTEAECRRQGFRFEWLTNDRLQLTNEQPAFKIHRFTGETAWFNHWQVFGSAAGEYVKIAAFRPSFKNKTLAPFTAAMTQIKKRAAVYENRVSRCTFADGSPIAESCLFHLVEVIGQQSAPLQWRRGDVIAIDNFSIAHRIWPYSGSREILVARRGTYAA